MKKFTILSAILIMSNLLSAQWVQQNLNYPVEGALTDIFFINHNHGWAVGESDEYGYQYHYTNDGGNEWHSFMVFSLPKANSIFFSDENNGWIVFDGGNILHSTDGGGNLFSWELQESGTGYDLMDVFFIDSLNGWVAGDSSFYPQVGVSC
ncbi:MAG: YCF48-related protein, partial [Bacteroidales bacterium]|nr:YCF48-related protein [Bacteroidales bacterium]